MSDEYNEEFQNTNENNIDNIDNENTRIKLKERIRKNKAFSTNVIQSKKRNYLANIVVNAILKNEKIESNIPIIKRYLLLYMRYYNYLTDNYYIKSITIVKAIYNYFRNLKFKIFYIIFNCFFNYK